MSIMRDEIREIPAVVERVLRDGGPELDRVAAAIGAAHPRFVAIAARGTSDHAAIYARYLIETHLGIPAGLAAPSVVTAYRADLDWRDMLVLAVSQSGQSPDIVAVVEAARRGGATTVAVTNDEESPLARAAEHDLDCRAGTEQAVAATKTYVAELAVLASLVARLAPRTELAGALPAVPDALGAAVRAGETWLETDPGVVREFAGGERAFVVSRGFNLATAMEIALKLKETALIFADGYSSADLLHGPVVLARADVPMLVVQPSGEVGQAIDDGLARARLAGARPWTIRFAGEDGAIEGFGVTDEASDTLARSLVLGALPEALTPLAAVIPGQLLADAVARARGYDPDHPVGLTKVTRTR